MGNTAEAMVHDQHDMERQKDDMRTFKLFPYLHEELKVTILSFVADAPFESMPENYPKSSLTHVVPLVCRKFRAYSEIDSFWKDAILRQVSREPLLWMTALRNICKRSMTAEFESSDLQLENAHMALGKPGFKSVYRTVVNQYIRFKGPVFYMRGQVQLGEPYGLHFFEPRYRLLVAEVMKDQPEEARNGGHIKKPAVFIHANRAPLAPTVPATLVSIVRCQLFPDGRADVMLLPVAYVWLEKLWVLPNSGHLYYAQCLTMGERVTMDMNKLARQEALAIIMDTLVLRFQSTGDDEDLEHPDEDGDVDVEHDEGDHQAAVDEDE